MQRSLRTMIGGCMATLVAPVVPAAACPYSDVHPDEISVADYAAGLACEINEERRAWGRSELHLQRNLTRAAGWHASDMVAEGYFSHTSLDGDELGDRLQRARFIPRSARWRAGENLAAGHSTGGTPAAIVDGWMNSPDHRYNLLDPGFTMAGIGVARGWPGGSYPQNDSMTITLDLGWRAPVRRSSQ
jgi:uncharacterized protein YkwD